MSIVRRGRRGCMVERVNVDGEASLILRKISERILA